jgi:hypothetical protein
LFNYLRRLGEAYAAAHGPYPGIDPQKFPSVSGFGLEDETPDFNSARRLRELIEPVEQVSRWMAYYNEDLVPKMGWSKLEKIYGPTHSPELWLIGKQLPAIFKEYILGNPRAQTEPGRAIPAATVSWLMSLNTQESRRIRTSRMKLIQWNNIADGHESQKASN